MFPDRHHRKSFPSSCARFTAQADVYKPGPVVLSSFFLLFDFKTLSTDYADGL
jgi:hypothetical protein